MADPRVFTTLEDLGRAPASLGDVWGYCRVSSDKQEDGQSLDVQQEGIRAYCASAGLGLHFAHTLAQAGAKLALGARRVERLDEIASVD